MNNEGLNKKSSTKEILIIGIVLLLVIVVFVEVFVILKGNKKEEEPKEVSRTFMIYMVGSDLESGHGFATVDLEDIDYESLDKENINVVAIAGGTSRWFNSYIDVNDTSIYELGEDGYTKVKQQDKRNMGAGDTLLDFLNYVYDNYKTDKYDLIFWNHGGAILGSEFDELYDSDAIDLGELDKALKASPFGKDNKLETVIYNTCLMQTLEVSSIISNYADYMVASEETALVYAGDGAFKFINEVLTTDNGYDVSKKYIDAYVAKINEIKDYYLTWRSEEIYIYTTYSIIDLSKIDTLVDAVNDLFKDMNVSKNFNQIAKVRSNLYQYGAEYPEYDMIDLYNLVSGITDIDKDKTNKVLNAIEDAVLYNYATNNKSRGLSIYFPFMAASNVRSAILKIYDSFSDFKGYGKFLKSFNEYKNSNVQSYSFMSNPTNVVASSTDSGSDFTLELTPEQLEGYARAEYIVFSKDKDGYYIPVYRGINVDLDGNTIKAGIKGKQLKVVDKENGVGRLLNLVEKEVTDTYITYTTTAILENFDDGIVMDTARLYLVYDKETGKISITNAVLLGDGTLPSSAVADMSKYTTIAFASSKYKILDANGNYKENWESNGVIEGIEDKIDNIEYKVEDFDDSTEYYSVFRIYDTNNNYYYSSMIKMN